MFKRIAVAYDESPESHRALLSAIELAKTLSAELETVTVMAGLPSYTAFAAAGDLSLTRTLNDDRDAFYERLQGDALEVALAQGITIKTHVIDGPEVDSILQFLGERQTDLLVVGLHHQNLYIARLWSTAYELARAAHCSVLGVH